MLEVVEDRQRAFDRLVTALTAQAGDRADATGVVTSGMRSTITGGGSGRKNQTIAPPSGSPRKIPIAIPDKSGPRIDRRRGEPAKERVVQLDALRRRFVDQLAALEPVAAAAQQAKELAANAPKGNKFHLAAKYFESQVTGEDYAEFLTS